MYEPIKNEVAVRVKCSDSNSNVPEFFSNSLPGLFVTRSQAIYSLDRDDGPFSFSLTKIVDESVKLLFHARSGGAILKLSASKTSG